MNANYVDITFSAWVVSDPNLIASVTRRVTVVTQPVVAVIRGGIQSLYSN